MKRKPYNTRRYRHIMWDGIYDTYKDPDCKRELSWTEMAHIMNDVNNEILVWQNKYDEMKNEYKKMKIQYEQVKEKYERCRNGKGR